MVNRFLTDEQENFIYKNHNLMTCREIADYLDLKRITVYHCGRRKGLKFKRRNYYDLTKRENQIAELVSAGLSNSDICEKLYIAPATVITHIRNIYQKYNIFTEKTSDKCTYRVRLVLEYLKRNHKLID